MTIFISRIVIFPLTVIVCFLCLHLSLNQGDFLVRVFLTFESLVLKVVSCILNDISKTRLEKSSIHVLTLPTLLVKVLLMSSNKCLLFSNRFNKMLRSQLLFHTILSYVLFIVSLVAVHHVIQWAMIGKLITSHT